MEDATFLAAFEAAAIPSERWRHVDHVRMAYLYLRDHDFDAALERIRTGIRRLNAANDVPETDTEGYHETATVAWATVVRFAIRTYGARETFEAFAAENPHLLAKSLLRLYYSRQCVLSREARRGFVPPDLAPLPDADAAAITIGTRTDERF